jgi:RNA polymerase sigma-70 factor (ECF subfamily)
MSSVKEIAEEYGISESKAKMSLMRTREKLREYLRKEGYAV